MIDRLGTCGGMGSPDSLLRRSIIDIVDGQRTGMCCWITNHDVTHDCPYGHFLHLAFSVCGGKIRFSWEFRKISWFHAGRRTETLVLVSYMSGLLVQ